jgi:hypothetical protein
MPSMTEPETPIQHWVADRRSARSAAQALLMRELARFRVWLSATAIAAALAVVFLVFGQGGRALALTLAAGLSAFLVGVSVVFAHVDRRRVLRHQLPPGLELTSQFGPDSVTIRGPWSESRISFDGFAQVETVGRWVLLLQRHRKVRVIYPVELFPDDDLARLRLVVAGYEPRDPDQ